MAFLTVANIHSCIGDVITGVTFSRISSAMWEVWGSQSNKHFKLQRKATSASSLVSLVLRWYGP